MHYISSDPLSISRIKMLLAQGTPLELSPESTSKIEDNYAYLHKKIEQDNALIYGINTGFGSLCNTAIDPEHQAQLQTNLVRSHACGLGDEVPDDDAKLINILIELRFYVVAHYSWFVVIHTVLDLRLNGTSRTCLIQFKQHGNRVSTKIWQERFLIEVVSNDVLYRFFDCVLVSKGVNVLRNGILTKR